MNNEKSQSNKEGAQDDIRELVIARVRAIPKDVRIAIGANNYSREELLDNIAHDSDVGREVIEIQMEYLRDLASGAIYAR